MCKLRKRRGFTLTELAIVIAIIAVLIAVLVPTFYTLIKNAKESSDSQLTKNMNEAITIEDATNTIETPEDAITAALSVGYSVENLSAKSEGNIIVYDQESTRFVLISEDLKTVVYKDSSTTKMGGDYGTATTWLFLETTNSSVVSTGTSGYDYVIDGNNSYILIGDGWAGKTIQVASASGIDTSQVSGEDTKVETTYVSNSQQGAVTPELAKKAITAGGIAGTEYPLIYNVKSAHLTYKGGEIDVKIYGSYYVSLAISSTNSNTITVANTVSYVDVTGSTENVTVKVEVVSGGSTKVISNGNVSVTNNSGTALQVEVISSDDYSDRTDVSEIVTGGSDVYTMQDENGVVTPASCETAGYTTYTYINNYTGATVTVVEAGDPATGHNYEAVWEWSDDYTTATAYFTCKNDNRHTGEVTASVSNEKITSEVTTVATCTATGVKTYTATVTFDGKEYTDTKTEEIAKIEHSYESENTYSVAVAIVDNTITFTGYCTTSYTCSACGGSKDADVEEITDPFENENTSELLIGKTLTEDNWTFTVNSKDSITLTSYSGNSREVTILSNVTEIAAGAFKDNTSLTTLVIPDNVTTIGEGAFSGCKNLESITLPFTGSDASATEASATTMFGYIFGEETYDGGTATRGRYAQNDYVTYYIPTSLTSVNFTGATILYGSFSECRNLTSVTIGENVTYMDSCAFENCRGLTEINFNATCMQDLNAGSIFLAAGKNSGEITLNIAANVTRIPANLFNARTVTGDGYDTYIKQVIFAEGSQCTEIADKAFGYNCPYLVSINLPDSLSTIGASAFYNCYRIKTLVIPNSVTTIGNQAFQTCRYLTSLTLGSGVTSIGTNAFQSCKRLVEIYNLSSLTITAGSTSSSNGTLGKYALKVYTSLSDSNIIEENNYIFIYNDSNYYLLGYTGSSSTIQLPNKINGNSYVIYNYAFSGDDSGDDTVETIIIPGNVTKICDYAFSNNKTIKTVNITGNDVTAIGDYAFEDCYSLKAINIPGNVSSIGKEAFSQCKALTNITISEGLTSIGQRAFEYSGIVSVTIPDSVTSIDTGAFSNCYNLVSVTLPTNSSYKTISGSTFSYCYNLASITIPSNITSIGSSAFYNCYSLVEVYNLSSLSITAGNTSSSYGYLGKYALNVYKTSTNVKTIIDGDYVFYNDDGTYYLVGYTGTNSSITLPSSINGYKYSIYQNAFYNNTIIESIVISDVVTAIGDKAFYNCSSLASVTIGSGVETIGDNAFYSTALTYISIPGNVTSIGSSAFYYCKSLVSVTINDGVETIGSSAFYSCSALTDVSIGDSVTSIGSSAFYSCTKLTNVTIGNSVKSIGDSAFNNCQALTSITIPASVTSIGKNAFYKSGLTSATFEDTENTWYKTTTENGASTSGNVIQLTAIKNTASMASNLTKNNYYLYKSTT